MDQKADEIRSLCIAAALPTVCLPNNAFNLDFPPSKAADTGAADTEHLFVLPLILQDLESVLWEAPQLFICQAAGLFLKPLLKARGQVGSRRCRLSAAAKWQRSVFEGRGTWPRRRQKKNKSSQTAEIFSEEKKGEKSHFCIFLRLRLSFALSVRLLLPLPLGGQSGQGSGLLSQSPPAPEGQTAGGMGEG